MADQSERSDFSAIRKAFTHDELAAYMALQIRVHDGHLALIDRRNLTETRLGPALVAKVERQQHGGYEVTVRERQRPSGYYAVYDPNYCADAVLWWDDSEATWFTTHEKTSSARGGNITVRFPLDITPKEASDGE
jgi:hypothetical protein